MLEAERLVTFREPLPPAFAVAVEREFPAEADLLLALDLGVVEPDFAAPVPFEPADRAGAAVFPFDFAGVAALAEPVDVFFTALEAFAANESSGRSRRLATTPPPSHMNRLRLAEGTPFPSSSGSDIPPPWD